MTDMINGLVVVLDADMRDEDAARLMAAIQQMRGVASVERNVADVGQYIARNRARSDLEARLWKALRDEL